jgi:hypothetical protein
MYAMNKIHDLPFVNMDIELGFLVEVISQLRLLGAELSRGKL